MAEQSLKLIISRFLEASAVRDILIDPDKLKVEIEENPALLETLRATVAFNEIKFAQNEVESYSLSQLGHINQTISQAGPDELQQISLVLIFMIEQEIYNISRRILQL